MAAVFYFNFLFFLSILMSVSLRIHRMNRCHFNEEGKTLPLASTTKEAISMSDMPS